MKTRLFEKLPLDVNAIITMTLGRVSDSIIRDLIHVRGVNQGACNMIDNFLRTQGLKIIASMPRAQIAAFLQQFYAPDSRPFAELKAAGSNHATYALYALVADVNELDAAKLLAAIDNLSTTDCPQRILASLQIIHHYITHGTDFDVDLVNLLRSEDIAYINLRGANLVANFTGCNLSYADLRNTNFFCCVTSANLEGANLCNAVVSDKTIFNETTTTNLKCEGLINKGMILEQEEDQQTGKLIPVVPEFACLYAVKDEPKRKPGFCNIL